MRDLIMEGLANTCLVGLAVINGIAKFIAGFCIEIFEMTRYVRGC